MLEETLSTTTKPLSNGSNSGQPVTERLIYFKTCQLLAWSGTIWVISDQKPVSLRLSQQLKFQIRLRLSSTRIMWRLVVGALLALGPEMFRGILLSSPEPRHMNPY